MVAEWDLLRMAITVNWATRVIDIPKADTTLIQSTPTEIRDLDLNAFHLTLRDLEDNVDGIILMIHIIMLGQFLLEV